MIIGLSATIGNGKDTVFQILQYLDYKKSNGHCNIDEWLSVDQDLRNSMSKIENKKFAYKLKLMVSLITGCDVTDLEKEEFKNSLVPLESLYKLTPIIKGSVFETDVEKEQYTYRELLQTIGDGFRNLICKDIWANSLFTDYTEDQKWIITDLRYENEFDAIKQKGGINIRIERKRTFYDWQSYFNLDFNNQQFLLKGLKMFKSEFLNMIKKIYEGKENFFKVYEHQSETGLNKYYSEGKFDYVIINDGSIEELVEKVESLKLI